MIPDGPPGPAREAGEASASKIRTTSRPRPSSSVSSMSSSGPDRQADPSPTAMATPFFHADHEPIRTSGVRDGVGHRYGDDEHDVFGESATRGAWLRCKHARDDPVGAPGAGDLARAAGELPQKARRM